MFGYKADNVSDTKLTAAINAFSKNVHKIFENSSHLMSFPPKLARILGLKIWTQFEKDVTQVLEMGCEIIDIQMKLDSDLVCDGGLFVKMRFAGKSIEFIKRIFVDLIVAAGDTTAFSIQWALYLLSQNSEIQKKIRYEDFTNNSEYSVLHGFIRETLRWCPVAPFIGRILKTDAIIGEYEVKKNPERWFRNSNAGPLRNVLQAHGTLPFVIGSRSCIGRKVALHQMYSLVSEITRSFEIKCFNEDPIEVVPRLVAVPNQPLKLGLKLLKV